jgi:hypothetical protein
MPNKSKSIGGQAYPSWAEAKAKSMARTNKVKPRLAGNSVSDFTMLTLRNCQQNIAKPMKY